MRSTTCIASAALGAALAGLVALGGTGGAFAQGMMMDGGPRKAAATKKAPKAAKPAKKRFYRSPAAVKTCGQFKYLSKGKCLDARTTPPKLK
jgi:hypothetical protein